MLYRIHQKVLVGDTFIVGGEGCVHALPALSRRVLDALLANGTISEVQAPPLSVFDGWAGRARKLDSLGIDTIGFIQMDARDVAYAIRASVSGDVDPDRVDKLALAVERWQGEIKDHLGIGSAQERR